MGTPERSLRALNLAAIKNREALIEEARRVTDLPPWVHAAILAEYDRDVFLGDMSKKDALIKHCEDVGTPYQPNSMLRLIRSSRVWRKTNVAVRMKHHAEIYYHEAERSEKYRNNTWSATKAVLHQTTRRRKEERAFDMYLNAISALAHRVDEKSVSNDRLSPERAQELLEMLPRIAGAFHAKAS